MIAQEREQFVSFYGTLLYTRDDEKSSKRKLRTTFRVSKEVSVPNSGWQSIDSFGRIFGTGKNHSEEEA